MSPAAVYLDHNASAPLRPEAAEAMRAALDVTGNPSSVHTHGRRARALIEDAREAVATLVDVTPARVVFTGGGSEAKVGVAGFGAAARAVAQAGSQEPARLAALRDRLEAGLRAACPEAVIHGAAAARLPNTTCLGHPRIFAPMLLTRLDLAGVSVSTGSACASGTVSPSHVLRAMGLDDAAASRAVRLSLGWSTTNADVDRCAQVWGEVG